MGRLKPLDGIQLAKLQPGQRRSGQAGSEPCLSPGDWRGRSVGREEAGREGTAPKSFTVADADAVRRAEGRIRTTASARSLGAAGVPSPGHAFTGIPQEPGRPPVSSRMLRYGTPDRKGPGPGRDGCPGQGNEQASTERYRAVKGDRRRPGWAGRSLRPRQTTSEQIIFVVASGGSCSSSLHGSGADRD
jgi:hypothetical protein